MTSGANAKLYLNLIGYPYDRELNGPEKTTIRIDASLI